MEYYERKKYKGELDKIKALFDTGRIYNIYSITRELNIPYHRVASRVRYLCKIGYIQYIGEEEKTTRGIPAKLYMRR